MPEVGERLLDLVPTVLWILFLLGLLLAFRRPIREQLLPRLTGVKALGVEVAFAHENLEIAASKVFREQHIRIGRRDLTQVLRRATRLQEAIRGAQILWVDDNPRNNQAERRVLSDIGIHVDLARNTSRALNLLRERLYDVVLSDRSRNGVEDEGERMLLEMRDLRIETQVVFYVGDFDPKRGTPAHAFGITNRPDHLIHFVLDVLDRERC